MPILTVVFTEGRNDLPHAYHQRQAIGGPFQGWPPALSFHDDVTHVDANHAAKYIEERHQAGNPTLAVPFYAEGSEPARKRQLRERLERENERASALDAKWLKALKEGKSKLVGCRQCGSKIARAHIEETACPVCLRLLVTAKQEAALDKVLDAIKELEDSIRGTPDLPKKGGAVCWLVGGYGPGPPPAF
jgi:hypothetical protein